MMRFLQLCITCALLIALSGCGPTYPKANLEKSMVDLCKREYNIDVKVDIVGRTLAIFIPLPSLLDVTFGMNEKAQEMIQNVLLSSSRITLSTDADIQFYCIIAQDVKLPELQVIIIKYIEDVKRAFYFDISRDEYFKRTIFDLNINPQSKKEQNIKEIFRKYRLDPEWEDQILEEFFRSSPIGIKDFGYWHDKFYIKDITLPEFMAEQMAYRVKLRFREEKALAKKIFIRNINSGYQSTGPDKFFYIDFDIKMDEVLEVMGEKINKKKIFQSIIDEASDCIYSYKFKDFSNVNIRDINDNSKLSLTRDEIYNVQKNKTAIDAIIKGL